MSHFRSPGISLLAVPCLVLLVACSGPEAQPGSMPVPVIRTIAIDSDVALVRRPFVQLPEDVWEGALLGGEKSNDGADFLGISRKIDPVTHRQESLLEGTKTTGQSSLIIRGETDESRKVKQLKMTKYKAFLANNGIDIKEIVYNSFKEKMAASTTDLKLADKKGDARLALNVSFYGIHESHPLSAQLKPMLMVEAELFVNGRTSVWKGKESIQTANDEQAPPHTMAEYEKDPKILGQSYVNLANALTTRLLFRLNTELPAPK